MFVDRVKIIVRAGSGGDGIVAFRREKYVPRGGPAGGDGGNGGDVILRVDHNMATLMDFRYIHTYKADNGKAGQGSNKTGARGEDRIIDVPPGTIVKNAETGEIIVDLIEGTHLLAQGGRGGKGNARFATSSNQAPRKATPGKPGEEMEVLLELKVIADVGLAGAPNAGKSTLLSRLSKARPKVADYPFTTLQPNLGIVEIDHNRAFVMCDIPGLIEGAHEGKGLGLEFLRHVERTRIILLMVDLTDSPEEKLEMLNNEIESYADGVLRRKECIVVGTKLDVADKEREWQAVLGSDAILISSVTGEGLNELINTIYNKLNDLVADEE
ncbi:MAG TPA: GTPase ObgE [candidate division Zixibacteria bacterium]|nr:GTPase ObgE [candidate division Zixibacteria bacterium]